MCALSGCSFHDEPMTRSRRRGLTRGDVSMRSAFYGPLLLCSTVMLVDCGGEPASPGVPELHALFADRAAEVLRGTRPLQATGEGFAVRALPRSGPSRLPGLDVDF